MIVEYSPSRPSLFVRSVQKGREARLRRAAIRQGLRLRRSRSRTPENPLYGTYGLIDADLNAWIACNYQTGYGLDLDEIEAWLA